MNTSEVSGCVEPLGEGGPGMGSIDAREDGSVERPEPAPLPELLSRGFHRIVCSHVGDTSLPMPLPEHLSAMSEFAARLPQDDWRTAWSPDQDAILRQHPAYEVIAASRLLRDPEVRKFFAAVQEQIDGELPLLEVRKPVPYVIARPAYLSYAELGSQMLRGMLRFGVTREKLLRAVQMNFAAQYATAVEGGEASVEGFTARSPYIEALSHDPSAPWSAGLHAYVRARPDVAPVVNGLLHGDPSDRARVLSAFAVCLHSTSAGDALVRLAASPHGAKAVNLCATVLEGIAQDICRIDRICRAAGRPMEPVRIRDEVLRRVNEILRASSDSLRDGDPELLSRVLEALREDVTNGALRRMQASVSLVTPAGFAGADLREVEEITPRTLAPAKVLRDDPTLHARVLALIAEYYPGGDAEDFEHRFLEDPGARLHMLFCGDPGRERLLAVVGTESMGKGLPQYVDWLCADMRGPIKGLSRPMLKTFSAILGLSEGTFHVAKPYVSLSHILDQGGVCDGVAREGEYKHRGYVTTRLMQAEQGAYPVKDLGNAAIAESLSCSGFSDLQTGRLVDWEAGGRHARVCKVVFSKMNHRSQPGEEHAWFYEAIRSECAAGRVLTAYVAAPDWTPFRQTFCAVFEQNALKGTDCDSVERARAVRREAH